MPRPPEPASLLGSGSVGCEEAGGGGLKQPAGVSQQVHLTHEELHDAALLQYGGLEFPQINYQEYNGRPYRFFYSCGFGHVFADSLLKMDVHTKELKVTSATETSL